MTKAKRIRPHGALPAGFAWREGRPRWIPSPTRRAQGWRGCDLKDAWGKWLAMGPAITRAEAIAQAVAAWSKGEPVPAGLTHIAPAGVLPAAGAEGPRAVGALLAAYTDSARFKRLAPRTQADYRSKLGRFLETLIGSADPAKIAAARALDIDVLLPPAFDEPGDFELERCYEALAETAGVSMAYGVHAVVGAWLSWCVKKRRVWPTNPAALVERASPEGRIVVYDWPELVALVRMADALGRPSIGDALCLAVDLSWSQQDLLALTWGQVADDFHVKHRRIKTGNAGNPRLLKLGQARIIEILLRWKLQKIEQLDSRNVIICEMTGLPWVSDTFRHEFAAIRAAVAKTVPSVAGKQFRDTRDTAITYAQEAGLEVTEICSRTLHSPERAQAVIAKHYGAIRQGLADEAATKLDAHFERMGYTLDPQLALPAPGAQ